MNLGKDIIRFWKDTWAEDKSLFFAEAAGVICSLTAALFLSVFSGQHLVLIFSIYIIGNVSFIYAAYKRKSSWILVMSIGFVLLNVYGLIQLYI